MLEVKIQQKLEKLYTEAEQVRDVKKNCKAKQYPFTFAWLRFPWFVKRNDQHAQAVRQESPVL